MTVDELKDLIKDIVAQEMGGGHFILSAMRSRATAMRCNASMSALANDFILLPGKGSRGVPAP